MLLNNSLKQIIRSARLFSTTNAGVALKATNFTGAKTLMAIPPSDLVAKRFCASTAAGSQGVAHDHSSHFKIERLWMVGMLPLFPAALFVHNQTMDFLLATAIALHVHWGFAGVMSDYKDVLGIGEGLKKASPYFIYLVSIIMYVGLLHFNYSDVGITKAFEMIWSL